jgi:RNA polymerase sigma-70 factor (ECF subfamily)
VTPLDEAPEPDPITRDEYYQEAVARFGRALDRLARAYEADADVRRDLGQEIHFALWRSFAGYDRRCSLRTWVYRVAHNTATSHVARASRLRRQQFVTLESLPSEPTGPEARTDDALDRHLAVERLYQLVHRLDPIDRQVMVSYLEGLEAAEIADIIGTSPGAVAMKIHRIKRLLAQQFNQGAIHGR